MTSETGAVDEVLRIARLAAIDGDVQAFRKHAESSTWQRCAQPLRRRVVPNAAS